MAHYDLQIVRAKAYKAYFVIEVFNLKSASFIEENVDFRYVFM